MASLSGQAKATGYELKGLGESINKDTGVYNLALPEFQDYIKYLNSLTSTDPNARFAAVAPAVQDITSQKEAAISNISQLPRGGEQDYLRALAEIGGGADISKLLTGEYAAAQAAKGQAGQFGLEFRLQQEGLAENALANAGAILTGQQQLAAAGSSATIGAIADVAAMVAMAV
jgi:hypothetical protein